MKAHTKNLNVDTGFSIVGALVAFSLLSIAAFTLYNLLVKNRFWEDRIDRGVKCTQMLASTALELQGLGFDSLYDICNKKRTLHSEVFVTGACVLNGKLAPNPQPAVLFPSPLDKHLEVRRDFSGKVSAEGSLCIEISQCKVKGAGHILEVSLSGYWQDADPLASASIKNLTFRKARW